MYWIIPVIRISASPLISSSTRPLGYFPASRLWTCNSLHAASYPNFINRVEGGLVGLAPFTVHSYTIRGLAGYAGFRPCRLLIPHSDPRCTYAWSFSFRLLRPCLTSRGKPFSTGCFLRRVWRSSLYHPRPSTRSPGVRHTSFPALRPDLPSRGYACLLGFGLFGNLTPRLA